MTDFEAVFEKMVERGTLRRSKLSELWSKSSGFEEVFLVAADKARGIRRIKPECLGGRKYSQIPKTLAVMAVWQTCGEIATALGVTSDTVRARLYHLYYRTDLIDRKGQPMHYQYRAKETP